LILRRLLHTSIINDFLNIKEKETRKSYEALRTALILSIKKTHASYKNVSVNLSKMYTFLKEFKKIISLNYDLIIYWAMRTGNDELGNWFKDCFLHGKFQVDWKWFEKHADGVGGATLVFYPHGSLFLATNMYDEDVKLARDSDNESLLDMVVEKWESEDFIPLVVSEGESSQKIHAIKRSFYLSNVYYDVLPDCGENIVMYGLSLNKNDDHILQKIAKVDIRKIALSIYCENKNEKDISDEIEKKKRKLNEFFPDTSLYFFNAQSQNCWIY